MNRGNLKSLTVSRQNPAYDSRNDCNAIIETATNTLIQGCATTVVPDSITGIGAFAFAYCSGLTSLTISEGVTTIGDGAFAGCCDLTNIKIPNSVTTIGELAFGDCKKLTKIAIPASVTFIGKVIFGSYYEYDYTLNTEVTYYDYLSVFDGCSEDLTICGYAGTCAEAYAKEFDIRFFDLNNAGNIDGKAGITINDVTVIQQYVAELITLEGDALMAADTNGDGVVNIDDATYLQMYLAEYNVVLG